MKEIQLYTANILYIQGVVARMKYIKFALFVGAFIFAMTFFTAETEAAGYDATLGGLVVYLSKAEATKLGQNLEDGGNGAGAAAILSTWVPHPLAKQCCQTILGLSALQARNIGGKLKRCSAKGARMTIPWPLGKMGWAKTVGCIQVSSR